MIVNQRHRSEPIGKQGCFQEVFAELTRCLTRRGRSRNYRQDDAERPSREEKLRQHLLVLQQRLRRVQSLGNDYAQVDFSDEVKSILAGGAPVK